MVTTAQSAAATRLGVKAFVAAPEMDIAQTVSDSRAEPTPLVLHSHGVPALAPFFRSCSTQTSNSFRGMNRSDALLMQ